MVIRTAESDRPRVKDPHEQDPRSRTRDVHGAIGGATMRLHHKKRSHVFTDSQTHVPSQGTEFVMNFALRYGGNRTHAGANPDLIRSATLTIRPTEYIRLVPKVPITCDGNIRYQSYTHGWPSG